MLYTIKKPFTRKEEIVEQTFDFNSGDDFTSTINEFQKKFYEQITEHETFDQIFRECYGNIGI